MAKEIQRTLEYSNVLKPADPSPDNMLALQIDISWFFPSLNRQVLFDMLADTASCAYPHTNLQIGDPMPTHPVFRTMLPIAVALAGQKPLLSQKQEDGTCPFYHWLFSRRCSWPRLFIFGFAFWYSCYASAVSCPRCQSLCHNGWCYFSRHSASSGPHLCKTATNSEGLFTSEHQSDKIQSCCSSVEYYCQPRL